MASEEKKITLRHNEYEITIKIKNDYEESRNALKKAIYFQDKDLEKFELFYIDEEEDENIIEEDNFEEAFNSSIWGLRPIDDNTQPPEPQVDLKEIKKQVKNKVNKAQKDINKKIEQIKEDLKQKFMKIANEKITANNLKYEEKIKKYEEIIKSLKEKNKIILEQVEKEHEASVQKILNDVSEYTEKKVEEELEQYNNEFSENLNSIIQESTLKIEKSNQEVKKNTEEIFSFTDKIKQSMDGSRMTMSEIFNKSQAVNNQK